MPGDLDRDVSPLAIPDVERVVVDVGHGLFPLQVVFAGGFPNGCLSLTNQNQKQPQLARMTVRQPIGWQSYCHVQMSLHR